MIKTRWTVLIQKKVRISIGLLMLFSSSFILNGRSRYHWIHAEIKKEIHNVNDPNGITRTETKIKIEKRTAITMVIQWEMGI